MEKEEQSGVFTPEEKQRLEDLQQLRQNLIKNLIGGDLSKVEVPKSGPDKILLGQMIDGTERQITTQAKLRLAKKETENQNDYRKMVAETFRSYKQRQEENPVSPADRQLPSDIEITAVPGEMLIGDLPLDAESFLARIDEQ